jgi:hypothetical protein
MTDHGDALEEIRDIRDRQLAYVEKHDFLYDGPGLGPDELTWVIREIEQLRAERDEARKIVIDLWVKMAPAIVSGYADLANLHSWVPDKGEKSVEAAISERLASTHFGAMLAAEGEPVVAWNDDGEIRTLHEDGVVTLLREAFDDPTDETRRVAELAVTTLQRRLASLRREFASPLADDDLEAAAARHRAASPGPWTDDSGVVRDSYGQDVALTGYTAFPGRDLQPWHRADAEFIVSAWSDVERLLTEVRRLRAHVEGSS